VSAQPAAVLVLGFRSRAALEQGILDSIQEAAAAVPGRRLPVVFLDNYSRDGTVQTILERTRDVDLLLAGRNEGYCTGVNLLLQYAARRWDPEHYILVDADNRAEPGAYRELLRFAAEHPRHGVVQPQVRSWSDRAVLYSCGHRYTADHWCMPRKELPADPAALLDQPSVSISSTLVRAAMLRDVGLLDPLFEMYYESSDICFRARAAGWRCACHPAAVTYNEGTTGIGPDAMHQRYYFNRNRLLFWHLHDAAVFAAVRKEAAERLSELERDLAASEWGLDSTDEASRRGLRDGLRECARPGGARRRLPHLDGWENGAAVVLRRVDSPS
jgi:GT2 family glycosyltransferase